MTNKEQLRDVNNPRLREIKTTAVGLPTQESMKQGLYVWKKYSGNPRIKYTITATQLNTAGKDGWLQFRMDSDEIDITAVPIEFWFDKIIRNANNNYWYGVNSATYGSENYSTNGYSVLVKWDAPNKILQFNVEKYTQSSIVDWTVEHHYMKPVETLDYTISDNPNKYPHRAFYDDGYWYEKVIDGIPIPYGISNFCIDKLVYTSKTYATNINHHSLGEIPHLVIVFANEDAPAVSGFTYEWGYFNPFTGDGNFLTGTVNNISVHATATNISTSAYPSSYFKIGVEYTVITMV